MTSNDFWYLLQGDSFVHITTDFVNEDEDIFGYTELFKKYRGAGGYPQIEREANAEQLCGG